MTVEPDPKSIAIIEQALGEKTPFAARIDAWAVQLGTTDRNRWMYVSDIREFAKANPLETVEGLTGATVQAWISSLDIAPKTINRKLSSLRNYWGWLPRPMRSPRPPTSPSIAACCPRQRRTRSSVST